MFQAATSYNGGFSFPSHTFPQYVGFNPSPHTLYTKQVLQLLTGIQTTVESDEDISEEKAACLAKNSDQSIDSYIFLAGTGCYNGSSVTCGTYYQTTVGHTQAGTPAFTAMKGEQVEVVDCEGLQEEESGHFLLIW